MASSGNAPLSARFQQTEVVLDQGGALTFILSADKFTSDVSVVIDIYDLDCPVHPGGHVGWWRYDPTQLAPRTTGRLFRNPTGLIDLSLDGATMVDGWRNPDHIDPRRLELLLVLRSTITNAILHIDRIPVVQSDDELTAFRSGFDRNDHSPRYAPPHHILAADTRVLIVSRNIFSRDAVGNLCLDLYRMLRQHRTPVQLFAENFDLAMNDIVNRRDLLPSAVQPSDIIIYFFSTHDPALAELVDLPCHWKIAYFHGVTQPKLLQVFDPELSMVCARAIKQIPLLARFDRLATNSMVNAARLRDASATDNRPAPVDIRIIAPKLVDRTEPFSPAPQTNDAAPVLLYVGRIKSHKRIEDLLHLYAEVRKLDPSTRCVIAGNADDHAYRDYLRWVQTEQLKLPDDAVEWLGSITDDELTRAYAGATVYVSMSEDEGFCLPLLEAMAHNVLVFAYDQPAVRETLGPAGVIFSEKAFPRLARRLQHLLATPETREAILETQSRRARELLDAMDGRAFMEMLVP